MADGRILVWYFDPMCGGEFCLTVQLSLYSNIASEEESVLENCLDFSG